MIVLGLESLRPAEEIAPRVLQHPEVSLVGPSSGPVKADRFVTYRCRRGLVHYKFVLPFVLILLKKVNYPMNGTLQLAVMDLFVVPARLESAYLVTEML